MGLLRYLLGITNTYHISQGFSNEMEIFHLLTKGGIFNGLLGSFLSPSEFPFGIRYTSLKVNFVIISPFKKHLGTCLVVQWLRLRASTAGHTGLIPGQGSCTGRVVWPKRKSKKIIKK